MQRGGDRDLHPVAYFSKKFLAYQTEEKEALGIISALLHFTKITFFYMFNIHYVVADALSSLY